MYNFQWYRYYFDVPKRPHRTLERLDLPFGQIFQIPEHLGYCLNQAKPKFYLTGLTLVQYQAAPMYIYITVS